MASFPLNLEVETITWMMFDELKVFEEPSLTQVIEGVMDELEPEGTIVTSTETGEEVMQEGTEEALESLAEEVRGNGGHKEEVHGEVEYEEDLPRCTGGRGR